MYLQSLAHDLRTPINNISCMSENLMQEKEKDLKVQSTMKVIKSSC